MLDSPESRLATSCQGVAGFDLLGLAMVGLAVVPLEGAVARLEETEERQLLDLAVGNRRFDLTFLASMV